MQGGDWFGSTLVGQIFFVWFGLAKQVWLFGCSLVEIWLYKCAYFTLKSGKHERIGLIYGVKHTYLLIYTNLVVFKKICDKIFNPLILFFI